MKIIYSLLLSLLISGCAQPKFKKEADVDLYLRADFTYWEANPAYKFKASQQAGISFAMADIIYDGNPYKFVIADKAWSENKNCGYLDSSNRQIIYNQWVELDCSYNADKNAVTPIQRPFELLPQGSGKYLFELKSNEQGAPTHLRVSAVKSKKSTKLNHSF